MAQPSQEVTFISKHFSPPEAHNIFRAKAYVPWFLTMI
jgi:hypothetical protein